MLELSPESPLERREKEAINKQYLSLKTLYSPASIKLLSYWLMGVCILAFIVLFLPWQQNIRAMGELTALSPQDRPQIIPSPIDGRVDKWLVQEGSYVEEGEVLVVVSEIKDKFFDPKLIQRKEEVIGAKEDAIKAKKKKIDIYNQQIQLLRNGLALKLRQNENKILQQTFKVESDSLAWMAGIVDFENAERQYYSNQILYDSGLVPLTYLEASKSKRMKAEAKILVQQKKLDVSRNERKILGLENNAIQVSVLDKIAKIESEQTAAIAEMAEAEGSLIKLRNELSNLKIRAEYKNVRAPQNGYIINAKKSGVGETVKLGSPLLTFMPDKPSLAVALEVDAKDVPFIGKNRHVRLQFEGWPAMQFDGRPDIAVGTFGGEIKVIDSVIGKNGKFRVLVTPDPLEMNEAWPSELRMGLGVKAWILLDEVPTWFEIWRQLNGFPPKQKSKDEAPKMAKKG
ncbi:HlyD family secretion protein [Sediminitomix flava]|uniref:Biotin/lipoyl-binding protein n=1 Tax=Sediminitomix flava TaxID=379075 RepID=A0A315ZH08_SEDFL|nr:biotin/lipoyl-binding protein [Sediminitomix flava]PWJ44791.1 biotin/lipoyl-binding protein [Sediminitomix flava]